MIKNNRVFKVFSKMFSSAPKSDFKPKVRSVESSIELDDVPPGERPRRPLGEGWRWNNGVWSRPIKCSGPGMGSEMKIDEEPPRSRRIRSVNDPFDDDRVWKP